MPDSVATPVPPQWNVEIGAVVGDTWKRMAKAKCVNKPTQSGRVVEYLDLNGKEWSWTLVNLDAKIYTTPGQV